MTWVLTPCLSSVQFLRSLDPGVDNGIERPSPWQRFGCDKPWWYLAGLGLDHPGAEP